MKHVPPKRLAATIAGVLLAITLQAIQAGPASSAERERYSRLVAKTADYLIAHQQRRPVGVSWVSVTRDGKPQETLDFYSGDAGIAYLLLKAYALRQEPRFQEAARDGIAFIVSRAKNGNGELSFDPNSNGLFEGNAGPGYLFLYAYRVTHEKRYLDLAVSTASYILANPDFRPRSDPDIISGAPGTGLFLLKLFSVTKDRRYREGAARLGDFLIERAEAQPRGVKWKVYGSAPELDYYFVGFSHGPAGIGYYLERLYRQTRRPIYHEYALMAMDYLESIAIHEKNYVKWYHEELKRNTRYPSQWCHGTPGIAPFFLVLYSGASDSRNLTGAEEATNYTLDQGLNIRNNPSVCHGVSGNAASLMALSRATRLPQYWQATQSGARLLEQSAQCSTDGCSWRTESKTDYSYMTNCGCWRFFCLAHQ
ncbi:MAG: lanthionine synthetase LanC family protein [Bryobacteraceae bacterium]